MRESEFPFGDELIAETESRRLTPSIGAARDSDSPVMDSSNEDFLFHLYRGSELLQDNRVHEAKEELERALHLQPRDSKGQDLLAVVYFRLKLYPRAIQIYEQLRRRNENDTALLLNLALCYLKTGQPQLARRDLEHLLSLHSTHARAWGYLGLACERLGDLAHAEHAFLQGGHTQMAKRVAARRGGSAQAIEHSFRPTQEVRDVAGAAYQELDAGELSFALAEPTSDESLEDVAAQSWRPHELGQILKSEAPIGPQRADTRKPDTKDGWTLDATRDESGEMAPSIPQLGVPQSLNRRPTLIAPVGAPPAHEHAASEYSAVARIPSYQPPSFTLDDAGAIAPPSVRRPVVAVPSPFGPAKSHEPLGANERRTLPPPDPANTRAAPSVPPPEAETSPTALDSEPAREAAAPSFKPQAAQASTSASSRGGGAPRADVVEPRPTESLHFPTTGVVLHPSGVALVHTTEEVGFTARLESIRAQQSGLKMQLLERHMKGKPTGESFGGVASPMILAAGEGQLVLAARPGRKLSAFALEDEMCFAREDVLLGFGAGLAFENGRLTTGEGEFVPVVQLRGHGAVLLEAIGEILTLPVRAERSLSVRREAILGWFGRLVPRAIAPGDAPCGQRGLVSFAGEGRVLITSA